MSREKKMTAAIFEQKLEDKEFMEGFMPYMDKYVTRDEVSGCDIWSGSYDKQRSEVYYKGFRASAARVMHALKYKEYSDGLRAIRKCQNFKCVRIDEDHAILSKGEEFVKLRIAQYGKAGNMYSRLTTEDVQQIRILPLTKKEKMVKFGISRSTYADIMAGTAWSREYHPESWPEKDEDIMTLAKLIEIRTEEIKERGKLKDAGFSAEYVDSYISDRPTKNYVEFELDGKDIKIALTEQKRLFRELNKDVNKILEKKNG